MVKKEVINKVKKYAKLITSEIKSVKYVILYGSYVNGHPTKWSDIDVAVVISGLESDWLEVSSKLYNLTENIDLRIEPILIDEKTDKSGFLDALLKMGETVYKSAA